MSLRYTHTHLPRSFTRRHSQVEPFAGVWLLSQQLHLPALVSSLLLFGLPVLLLCLYVRFLCGGLLIRIRASLLRVGRVCDVLVSVNREDTGNNLLDDLSWFWLLHGEIWMFQDVGCRWSFGWIVLEHGFKKFISSRCNSFLVLFGKYIGSSH